MLAARAVRASMASPTPKAPRTPHPDTLVLSGGGVKGLAMLGAVEKLRSEGVLSKVRTVVGTSAGALIGTLVATHRDFRGALDVICTHGYKPDFDFARLASGFGLDSGKSIESLATALLADLPPSITFADVRKMFGTTLIVCVTNVSKRRAEYLGPDTHPDMPVVLALRMTCSVPLYFSAVKFNDSWYVDGSIVDNFPCDWAAHHGAKHVVGIVARAVPSQIRSFDAFIGAVVESAASNQPSSWADILDLQLVGVVALHFGAPAEELTRLFTLGVEQADVFVKKRL